MTPKEKALELVDKYLQCVIFNIKQEIKVSVIESAKQCTLISVNEIIKQSRDNEYTERYWNEVKQEIEKL
jgi:hypothetical protein